VRPILMMDDDVVERFLSSTRRDVHVQRSRRLLLTTGWRAAQSICPFKGKIKNTFIMLYDLPAAAAATTIYSCSYYIIHYHLPYQ